MFESHGNSIRELFGIGFGGVGFWQGNAKIKRPFPFRYLLRAHASKQKFDKPPANQKPQR